MSVIITPADQEDARRIAAELENGILAWPGYELRANSWPAPAVFLVPEAAAMKLLERLYGKGINVNVQGAPTPVTITSEPAPVSAPAPVVVAPPAAVEPEPVAPVTPTKLASGGTLAKKAAAAVPKPGKR